MPGLALLIATGGLAWLLALEGGTDPRLVCFAVFAPVLGLMLGGLLGAGPEDIFDSQEQWALLATSLMLGLAIGKALWSLGPVGELYEGTISRTLVPEGRPDSRISFFVTELVANGGHPYGMAANTLFGPYNFSSRGPLPGLGSAPIVLLSGGSPELNAPEAPWQPFDPQGFMAYRLAMFTFSCTVFLSLWELVRRLGGVRAARFSLLLAISTPFVAAEMWFTWPKLLAASFVLLAGLYTIERHSFRSGLLVGIGYLMHPSALIGLVGIGPLTLWPLKGRRWWRPDLKAIVLLIAGTAISVGFWHVVNGPHFFQNEFLEYVTQAYPHLHPTIREWVEMRLLTLANTLVPLFQPIFNAHNPSINTFGGISPGVVHFFFQYWTGVPFGFGIFFFPLLLASLWRAGRRWPWPVVATVILPFLGFAVYWGSNSSGLLREGIQAWVLVLLAVIALQQAASNFPWLRSLPVRVILALRGVEVFALAVGATLGTRNFQLLSTKFTLNDAFAVATIIAFSSAIVAAVWIETARIGQAQIGAKGNRAAHR